MVALPRTRPLAILFVVLLTSACGDTPTEPDPPGGGDTPDLSNLPGTIFFVSDREFGATPTGPGRTELYSIHPDGTAERQLTDNAVVDNLSYIPSVHPSGRSVLVENLYRTQPNLILDVLSVDLEGNVTSLTHNLENNRQNEWPTDPQWSPDGTTFLSDVQPTGDGGSVRTLTVFTADGSDRWPLLPGNTAINWKARWSPTGEWIAFLSAPNTRGDWKVFVVRPDGTDLAEVKVAGVHETPAWSPDGSRIVFSASQFGRDSNRWSVWQANADGSNPTLLIESSEAIPAAVLPQYSPDGQTICFIAQDLNGHGDVYLANADGSNVRAIAPDPADDRNVSFSPDGQYIVFATRRFAPEDEPFQELMVVSVDNGTPVRITDTHYNWWPVWVDAR